MNKTVVAIFNSVDEAQDAADQLSAKGFSRDHIDVFSGRDSTYEEDDGESGISRFFKNLFGSDDDKRERYAKVAKRGYLVTVYADSEEEAEQAAGLLDNYGAIDVDENYDRHIHDRDEDYDSKERTDDIEVNKNKTIPVIEEDIKVGKREVPTGGVRIRSRIVEKPVEENLRLREEHIHVERKKVDRPATEEELRNFKTGTTEFKEHAEIPDVQKRSRVVEEVKLAKDVDHRDETVHDSVKKTQVDVEDINPDDPDRYDDPDRDIDPGKR
ncbi:MAG TPA: YsnF/AvaK domain-containing protein [Hanamia sp.]|nr:YsnF/AvaK domain-containing protein [Hanamia sp.]